MNRVLVFVALIALIAGIAGRLRAAQPETVLPAGVRAVWDLQKAGREKTPTRERVCLNGLWRWQPAESNAAAVPASDWGYFKVPGCWPGITDYQQKDCQTVFTSPAWKDTRLGSISAAWYEREFTVPPEWKGRRVALNVEYLNSLATVYVDGTKVGDLHFPAGDLDLSAACRPGGKHRISMLVVALPLKGVLLSYNDTSTAKEVRGTVERRGLCGDVFLDATPAGARIEDVKIDPSVRKSEVTFDVTLNSLAPAAPYTLRARVRENGGAAREFVSRPFQAGDLKDGRYAFTAKWKPAKLWDINTPQNMDEAQLTLLGLRGAVADEALPTHFGFREFWIQGRDFYLNGSRIWLAVVPIDSAAVGAAWASYAGAKESLERLKSFGINFVYTHNYGCQPGSHLGFNEILRAADDVGMLVAFSQPHFSHYDWQAPDADQANGYARHAAWYVRVAEDHPSVIAYAMSHNATGYGDEMNPDAIDGIGDPRKESYMQRNAKLALRAEAIVERLDPSRIVYHHSSGNLGTMHTSNFYVNFAPVQELSDWFEHWATKGVKPVFLCEYGVPFSWDWTMYRGWYNGQREFGSAVVPWEFCLAEWNAQFFGDPAYKISDREKANLRWEAEQFRAGKLWHRWDYPNQVGAAAFNERNPVFAQYLTDNWRAYRTWGVSAFSPWEHAIFWKLRDGVNKDRKQLSVDWERLQKPGFSPDYLGERYEVIELAYDRSDWLTNAASQSLLRNNMPLLSYIAGPAAHFTSKEHNFLPGETIEKQLILINNSRATVTADCRWTLIKTEGDRERDDLRLFVQSGSPWAGRKTQTLPTGEQARIPLRLVLPTTLAPGRYDLRATVRFSSGVEQTDTFAIDVLPRPPALPTLAKVALFDPKGETARLLDSLRVAYSRVEANADLAPYELLIVGKGALSTDGAAPDLALVRDGLKVIVFEQTGEALEQRLGFRIAEYGLRQLFERIPDHPLLAGLGSDNLRDWRGEATILPPRLKYVMRPRYGPTVKWCGIDVPRVWRCGNRGNVASVLIEKPARGDFLPIIDGGYAEQYSPLLEYREGRGMVLFCQLDVTGRTETEPAADRLARAILGYAAGWKSPAPRQAVYAGDAAGLTHLRAAGFECAQAGAGPLPTDGVLILGPGGGEQFGPRAADVAQWLRQGGRVLAVGLGESDANALLPDKVQMKKQEHIAAFFEPAAAGSPLAGVAPADIHNRDPRQLPLVTGGATAVGDGVLATTANGSVVFCQEAPWQFDAKKSMNLKRTFRRASCLLARLAANAGVPSATPLLARFGTPTKDGQADKRWLDGYYLDIPEEWDDPYRFFGW